jgi:hypothetical protein
MASPKVLIVSTDQTGCPSLVILDGQPHDVVQVRARALDFSAPHPRQTWEVTLDNGQRLLLERSLIQGSWLHRTIPPPSPEG